MHHQQSMQKKNIFLEIQIKIIVKIKFKKFVFNINIVSKKFIIKFQNFFFNINIKKT